MKKQPKSQGFTLIEMAMVLVIIGLIIGGILKGRAVIENAKVKNVVNSADELRAGVMTFYDKYGQYPGDESIVGVPQNENYNGNADGQIDDDEEEQLFEDLANADIISGDYDGSNVANHAFGHKYRLEQVTYQSKEGHWISYDNLPYDVCQQIDSKHDDGDPTTGSIRAENWYTEGNTLIDLYIQF